MSEEVDFEIFNDADDTEDISTDNQNLKKSHEDFGANKETLEILDELIQNKESFPETLFLEIIKKVAESGEKEVKNKLYDFYCFLKKYGENIKSENLANVIQLKNDKELDIFSFWKKKLNHNILDNLLESKKMELSDFFKNFSDELIEKGYEVKNIFNLICQLKEHKSEENIISKIIIESIINILKIYKIENIEFYEVIKLYIKNLNENSPKEIYNIACKDKKKLDDLNQEELLKEIEKRNPTYFTEERKNILERQMKIVYETYIKNEDFSSKEDIQKWKQDEHFIEFKRNYKQNKNRFEISAEILAIISIANEIFTSTPEKKGYKLRDIQIMDVLLFINKNEEKGLIEEISTGEGKSAIICALATFLALMGKKVDIVTSALNLAKRDATDLKGFYGLFGLTVGCVENSNPEPYKEDIIYGTFLEYEADYLKDITGDNNEKIRRGRPFEVLIVDEIDNIFIDNIGGSTRLIYTTSGYQFLAPVFINIFFIMKTYYNELKKIFIDIISKKKIKDEEKNDLLNLINEESFRSENFYPVLIKFTCNFIRNLYDVNENKDTKESNKDQLEKRFFEEFNKKHHLPVNLKILFNKQLESWVDNAYKAIFNFHEDIDYVVSNNYITPVDKENTGEVEQRKQYRDGLHRMLEIKHGLILRDESVNHTFFSHISFFKQYKEKNKLFFYGLTGTIGDNNTLNIFKDEKKFNSEVLFIPTYKSKRFIEFPAILCDNEEEQKIKLYEEIKDQIEKNRKILVINNTIDEATKLKEYLLSKNIQSDKIGLYTRDDDKEQMKIIEKKEVDIILSTNLAGRGTDIKTNEIEENNGGLHIILTTMPNNLRVERQAYGRTSRQGKKGSGRMIILKKNFGSIKEYKDKRNEIEKKRLDNISRIMTQTLFQDKLFKEFNELLKEYRKGGKMDRISKEDIEERWGNFLIKNIDESEDINNDKIEEINSEFEKFKTNLENDLKDKQYNKKIQNSFLNISYGFEYCKNKPKEQEICNKKALNEERYSFAAYYYNTRILIENSKIGRYPIEEIIKNLEEAKNILEQILEENVYVSHNELELISKELKSDKIINQMKNRINLIKIVIEQIEENIKIAQQYECSKDKEYIEIICKIKDLEDVYKQKKKKDKEKEKDEKEEQNEIDRTLNFLKDSGLYELYELDLRQRYRWYHHLGAIFKIFSEFVFGFSLVLVPIIPIAAPIVGGFVIVDSIVSLADYFISIYKERITSISDFFLHKNLIKEIRKINISIGKDITDNYFSNIKYDFIQDIDLENKSNKLNELKKLSKKKIENYIAERFNDFIEKQKEHIEYLLCFDKYLKNNYWKNEIKNELETQCKEIMENNIDIQAKAGNILKEGYEKNNHEETSDSVEKILKPIIKNCFNSLDESIEKFMQKNDYKEDTGLNSLEHIIRNLNSKEIDDKLAQEIIEEFKKFSVINDENKITDSINHKTSLKFFIESDLKNIKVEEKDFSKLNLSKLKRKPIINDDMDDKINKYKKDYEGSEDDFKNFHTKLLNIFFIREIQSIVKSFSEYEMLPDYLEELKNLISGLILDNLNENVYSKIDAIIIGDISSNALKDAEPKVWKILEEFYLKKKEEEKGEKVKK